jgi:hypothetical protein
MLGSNPSDRLSGRKGRGRAAPVPFDEIKNIHSGGKKAVNPRGLGAAPLKRGEKRDLVQSGFDFQDAPKEVLRAVQVTPNDAARAVNLVIFQNMRVPARSLISEVFLGNVADAHGVENLSWWESSDGSQLPDVSVFLQARQAWGGVQAIISPQ